MARIPTLDDDETRRTRRTRLGREGLDALMRDDRYWDGDHPDHEALVDLMRKGFELVFGNRPAGSAGPRRPSFGTPPIAPPSAGRQLPRDPFAESFARLVPDEDDLEDLPPREREALGRNIVLHALRKTGHRLPEGFEDEAPKGALGSRLTLARHNDPKVPMRTMEHREGDSQFPAQPREAQVAQANEGRGATVPDPTLNRGKPRGLVPIEKWQDPWLESPVSREFRHAIHSNESTLGNYQTENGTAWGRYQLTETGRKQIKLEDEKGRLTGKYGIHSKEQFLNDPLAQEKAFADYMKDNEGQLRSKDA